MVYCVFGYASGNSVCNKCLVPNLQMTMKLHDYLSVYMNVLVENTKMKKNKNLSSAAGNRIDCVL